MKALSRFRSTLGWVLELFDSSQHVSVPIRLLGVVVCGLLCFGLCFAATFIPESVLRYFVFGLGTTALIAGMYLLIITFLPKSH